jgi:hypothetical protein
MFLVISVADSPTDFAVPLKKSDKPEDEKRRDAAHVSDRGYPLAAVQGSGFRCHATFTSFL